MTDIDEIPIIWKKPHNSANIFHVGTFNILLDEFLKRYEARLQIKHIMIDLEMPKDAAGLPNKTFIVKLHVKLKSGKINIAESQKRSVTEAMRMITEEIDNQTRSTDRQKHHDSSRESGY